MNKQGINLLRRILKSKKLSFSLILAILAFVFSFNSNNFSQFLPKDLMPQSFLQKELNAKVLRVIDGDTAEVLVSQQSPQTQAFQAQKLKVRLYAIDAPEKTQAYGKEAKEYLNALILNKEVKLIIENKDKYNRLIATIYLGTKDINQALVKNGYAWAYESFSTKYLTEQADAKMFKLGLWKDENAIKPSEFRKSMKK